MAGQDFDGFRQRCAEAREKILSFSKPLLVHHYDSDGISSGSLVSLFLDKNGIDHEIMCIRKLDGKTFEAVKSKCVELSGEAIFTDLGSNCERLGELKSAVVIDHHQALKIIPIGVIHANAMEFGFDGGSEISGATAAYSVCGNDIHIGIVGAVGDMQYPFKSLNKLILEEAKSKGIVEESEDILLYGKGSRKLTELLCFSTEPYLPGLTGDYQLCKKLVEDSGLSVDSYYHQLAASEKQKLVSSIVRFLVERNCGSAAKRIIGPVYTFSLYDKSSPLFDAHEFSTLLNACGRHGKPEIGVGVCKGDPEALKSALRLLDIHRKMLSDGIGYAYRNQVEFDNFYFIDGRGVIPDSIIGTVCGMLNVRDKPLIGISTDENGLLKASGRGTKALVDAGLNLGTAMSEIAQQLGGMGGGHKIAAGATFPPENLNKFLKLMNKKLKAQLEAKIA